MPTVKAPDGQYYNAIKQGDRWWSQAYNTNYPQTDGLFYGTEKVSKNNPNENIHRVSYVPLHEGGGNAAADPQRNPNEAKRERQIVADKPKIYVLFNQNT